MSKKYLSLLLALMTLFSVVDAKVTSSLPTTVAEGEVLNLRGRNFDTTASALAASLKTTDGTTITLDTKVVDDSRFRVTMPSVSSDTKAVLRISGGGVSSTTPEEFLILILDKPAAAFENPDNGDDLVAVPSTVSTDIQASTAKTVTSATQSSITTLPAVTSIGATGLALSIPSRLTVAGGIVGTLTGAATSATSCTTASTATTATTATSATSATTATTAGTVTTASQPSITTLAAFVNGGTLGTPTRFKGTIIAEDEVNGNIIGNVTGNVTGNLTGTVNTASQASITTLAGFVNGGTTAVSTRFQGPIRAKQGIVSNGDIDLANGLEVVAASFNGTAIAALTDVANGSNLDGAIKAIDLNTATTFSASGLNFVTIDDTGVATGSLATITGGRLGQRLTLLFLGPIDVADDDVAIAANALDIDDNGDGNSANNLEAFSADDILQLIYDGSAWHELSRTILNDD